MPMFIDRAGLPFIGLAFVPSLVCLAAGMPLPALLLSVLGFLVALFFRDPARESPREPGVVVAPADGRVLFAGAAEPDGAPPGELAADQHLPVAARRPREPCAHRRAGHPGRPRSRHVPARVPAGRRREQRTFRGLAGARGARDRVPAGRGSAGPARRVPGDAGNHRTYRPAFRYHEVRLANGRVRAGCRHPRHHPGRSGAGGGETVVARLGPEGGGSRVPAP